jgi:flagellin
MAQPMAIMTNVGSLSAQTNVSQTSQMMGKSIARLSSGLRVQSAADDAAGMAVSEGMRAQLRGFQQAARNASDGVSMLQTAESGYQSISDSLVRMRELAVQSGNDSITDTERAYINTEFQDLTTEIDRVSNSVEYNGIKLLDGTAGTAGSVTFQVGTRNTSDDRVTVSLGDIDATSLGVNASAVDTLANSQTAIDDIDAALNTLATSRSEPRLQHQPPQPGQRAPRSYDRELRRRRGQHPRRGRGLRERELRQGAGAAAGRCVDARAGERDAGSGAPSAGLSLFERV